MDKPPGIDNRQLHRATRDLPHAREHHGHQVRTRRRPAPRARRTPAAHDDTWTTFAELWNEELPDPDDRPLHRILGYPDPIQGDPWRELPGETPAREWRLLVQIDSEPDALLGDGGVWMVFVPRRDLGNRDLSRAYGVWQTH